MSKLFTDTDIDTWVQTLYRCMEYTEIEVFGERMLRITAWVDYFDNFDSKALDSYAPLIDPNDWTNEKISKTFNPDREKLVTFLDRLGITYGEITSTRESTSYDKNLAGVTYNIPLTINLINGVHQLDSATQVNSKNANEFLIATIQYRKTIDEMSESVIAETLQRNIEDTIIY